MKRLLAFITLACICGTAVADTTWTLIAASAKGNEFSIKNGSCIVGRYTDDHVGYVRCIERRDIPPSVYLMTIEASASSCRKQYGSVVLRELNGKVITSEAAVFDGGNVASAELEVLCSIAEQLGMPQ
jgi:hypothetical protein